MPGPHTAAKSPAPAFRADLRNVGVTPASAIASWPGVWDAAIPEAESRRLFQRTLAGWATDVLRLKRRGLDVPVLTRGETRLVTPGRDWRKAA